MPPLLDDMGVIGNWFTIGLMCVCVIGLVATVML